LLPLKYLQSKVDGGENILSEWHDASALELRKSRGRSLNLDQSEEFRKLYPLQVNFTMLSLVDCMNHFPVLVLGNFNTAEVREWFFQVFCQKEKSKFIKLRENVTGSF
jgi:hypothetical protein